MLRLYNTLTREVEEFKPISPPEVGYYSCGPTVYTYAHIGHARTYIFADILHRVLEFNGYQVKRVMNITDVGHLTSDADTGMDKMEKEAKRENRSVWEIAKYYTDDFFLMLDKLNIKRPEIICRATDHITSMIRFIEVLEKKGYTYQIADGIYFDTSKFPDYGKLSGQTFVKLQKTLKAGARVEVVVGKKHPTDFALWKLTPPGVKRQMEWDSLWGRGFPGWHIECSTMSMKYLGETFDSFDKLRVNGEHCRTIDIHTGGVDHIPIHHSNEIAQSEAATGKSFVRFWLHAEHLLVNGQKMSKSLNNFYRVADIEKKGYEPLALRYLFLTSSYRAQMNFTWKSIEAAQNAFAGLQEQIRQLVSQKSNRERTSLSGENLEKINKLRNKFTEVVNDDLNTAKALGVVWEVVKSNIPPEDKYDLIMLFDEVLGLRLGDIHINVSETVSITTEVRAHIVGAAVPKEILDLIGKREQLRKEKKFGEADKIRKELEDKGYKTEDSSTGPVISKKIKRLT